ncbi:uncharacterized protein LOC129762454 isoform X2 [Toxorhynchites rutilus septentrionalis]|uniref:uncharacterized protein LOC129762454 isoform X2 n=1 Tax=Toxorhynchites rutilus septentrionalis TaxID=329112 RepID=UPI00247ABF49|nr:uncharacterized protein LOC129762454 isoform X2 [Toxorhynchites rutilus septentrionalis]
MAVRPLLVKKTNLFTKLIISCGDKCIRWQNSCSRFTVGRYLQSAIELKTVQKDVLSIFYLLAAQSMLFFPSKQRFNRQNHEIESYVVRIYRHNLIKDGGIIKRKPREKLFDNIKPRRNTRVKMDELGWVLMNHDLITRNEPIQQHANGNRLNHFKFNMERLRNLLELS